MKAKIKNKTLTEVQIYRLRNSSDERGWNLKLGQT